jgi:hypothetical protein
MAPDAKRPVRPREIHQTAPLEKLAAEYFERFPKGRYLTEIESWRHLQSDSVEFTMKRLRDPIDNVG